MFLFSLLNSLCLSYQIESQPDHKCVLSSFSGEWNVCKLVNYFGKNKTTKKKGFNPGQVKSLKVLQSKSSKSYITFYDANGQIK